MKRVKTYRKAVMFTVFLLVIAGFFILTGKPCRAEAFPARTKDEAMEWVRGKVGYLKCSPCQGHF